MLATKSIKHFSSTPQQLVEQRTLHTAARPFRYLMLYWVDCPCHAHLFFLQTWFGFGLAPCLYLCLFARFRAHGVKLEPTGPNLSRSGCDCFDP